MKRSSLLFILMISAAAIISIGCGAPAMIEVSGVRDTAVSAAQTDDTDLTLYSEAVGEAVSETDDGAEDSLVVYVCGAVNSPGVCRLPKGSRVYEALEMAGGFTSDADTEYLNQASELADGQMLQVFTAEETAVMAADGNSVSEGSDASSASFVQSGGDSSSGSSQKINLNTAGKDELMTLPGIGESKAESIIRYREENGAFVSPEDVMNISGIKNSVYSKIEDLIEVG